MVNSCAPGATAVFACLVGGRCGWALSRRRHPSTRGRLRLRPTMSAEDLHRPSGRRARSDCRWWGRAQSIGVVDEIIDPATTRSRLAAAIAAAPARRGRHKNIPL